MSQPLHQYSLDGVLVDFPYEAYPLQLAYMTKVIQSLKHNKNALLESPTGTGKTLCLLCASLAWKRHEKEKSIVPLSVNDVQAALNIAVDDEEIPQQGFEPGLSAIARFGNATKSGTMVSIASNGSNGSTKILYAARTHSQLSQVVKELKDTSYNVSVCILASRQQLCIHEKVKTSSGNAQQQMCRALTSKNACKYHRNLEPYLESNGSVLDRQVHDIEDLIATGDSQNVCPYFLARHNLAEAEVILVPYNYIFEPATRKVIGLDKLLSNSVIIFDEAHNLEGFCTESTSFDISPFTIASSIEEVNKCQEKLADDLARAEEQGTDKNAVGVVSLGKSMMAKVDSKTTEHKITKSDLDVLKILFKSLEDAIQGHMKVMNIKDGHTESGDYIYKLLATVKILPANVERIILTMEAAATFMFDNAGEATGPASNPSFGKVSAKPMATNQQCSMLLLASKFRMLFDLLTPDKAVFMKRMLSYRVHFSAEQKRKSGFQNASSKRPFGKPNSFANSGMEMESVGPEVTLHFWCFNPGVAMNQVRDLGVKSMIVTSGTLAPLSSFAHELEMHFDYQLENLHVVSPSQVNVSLVNKGPAGTLIKTSYENRDNEPMMLDLGSAVVNFSRVIPDGLLVFFSSYPAMDKALSLWSSPSADSATKTNNSNRGYSGNNSFGNNSFGGGFNKSYGEVNEEGETEYPKSSVLWRISQNKRIIIEPKGSQEFASIMQTYRKSIDEGRGAIFFGVCRGKASEGFDFSNSAARGVIVAGIPYPSLYDPRVKIKHALLDSNIEQYRQRRANLEIEIQNLSQSSLASDRQKVLVLRAEQALIPDPKTCLTGQSWYNQSAARAVNQAMGRVIRHRFDYGSILLCDQRFGYSNQIQQLSCWIRPMLKQFDNYGQVLGSLAQFFKQVPGHVASLQGNTLAITHKSKSNVGIDDEGEYFGKKQPLLHPNHNNNKSIVNNNNKSVKSNEQDNVDTLITDIIQQIDTNQPVVPTVMKKNNSLSSFLYNNATLTNNKLNRVNSDVNNNNNNNNNSNNINNNVNSNINSNVTNDGHHNNLMNPFKTSSSSSSSSSSQSRSTFLSSQTQTPSQPLSVSSSSQPRMDQSRMDNSEFRRLCAAIVWSVLHLCVQKQDRQKIKSSFEMLKDLQTKLIDAHSNVRRLFRDQSSALGMAILESQPKQDSKSQSELESDLETCKTNLCNHVSKILDLFSILPDQMPFLVNPWSLPPAQSCVYILIDKDGAPIHPLPLYPPPLSSLSRTHNTNTVMSTSVNEPHFIRKALFLSLFSYTLGVDHKPLIQSVIERIDYKLAADVSGVDSSVREDLTWCKDHTLDQVLGEFGTKMKTLYPVAVTGSNVKVNQQQSIMTMMVKADVKNEVKSDGIVNTAPLTVASSAHTTNTHASNTTTNASNTITNATTNPTTTTASNDSGKPKANPMKEILMMFPEASRKSFLDLLKLFVPYKLKKSDEASSVLSAAQQEDVLNIVIKFQQLFMTLTLDTRVLHDLYQLMMDQLPSSVQPTWREHVISHFNVDHATKSALGDGENNVHNNQHAGQQSQHAYSNPMKAEIKSNMPAAAGMNPLSASLKPSPQQQPTITSIYQRKPNNTNK